MAASGETVYDLTETIGACGKFQVAFVISVQMGINVMVAGGMLFLSFGVYNPGWTCLDHHLENMTLSDQTTWGTRAGVLYEAPLHVNFNSSSIDGWSMDCRVKKSCQHLVYNSDASTVVTEWDLSCDRVWISSAMISIQMAGVLIGCYLSGQIGDRFGRKVCLYGFVALHGLVHLAAAFLVHWQMHTVFVFLIGVALGGNLTCIAFYPFEFVNDWWRGTLASLPFWNFGCILFTLIAYVLKDWRHLHITYAVISLCAFLPVFWTPESVRWLTVSGKEEKAKTVVARIARINGQACSDTAIIDVIAGEEKKKMKGRKYTYLDLFKMPSIRMYTIKFGLLWILFASSYYALNFGVRSFSGNFYLNLFLFSLVDLPGNVSMVIVVNRIGRRKSSLMYLTIAVVACFGIVLVFFATSGQTKGIAILVLALLSKVAILGVWCIIAVFSLELHPTTVRSLHSGFINCVARIGSILSPYIIPNDPNMMFVPYLILGILFALAIVIIWPLPETKGKSFADSDVKSARKPEETGLHDVKDEQDII